MSIWDEGTTVNGVAIHMGTDERQITLNHWEGKDGRQCIVISLGSAVSLHVSSASHDALIRLARLASEAAALREPATPAKVIPLHQRTPEQLRHITNEEDGS